MLTEKKVLHSTNILWESGNIDVRIDTVIVDDETGEVKSRIPWRGVVEAGDTARATALLGERIDLLSALDWERLEIERTEKIAASRLDEAADRKGIADQGA